MKKVLVTAAASTCAVGLATSIMMGGIGSLDNRVVYHGLGGASEQPVTGIGSFNQTATRVGIGTPSGRSNTSDHSAGIGVTTSGDTTADRSFAVSVTEGSLRDFVQGKPIVITDDAWMLQRDDGLTIVMLSDDARLVAIHSDRSDVSVAHMTTGMARSLLDFLPIGGVEPGDPCGGPQPCQLDTHSASCYCLAWCNCGEGNICEFEAVEPATNVGSDEPGPEPEPKLVCRWKCCEN